MNEGTGEAARIVVPRPRIFTPADWKARPPKSKPVLVGKPKRILWHGTAGHHAEISLPKNESLAELFAYARSIQNFHMDARGWNDSGHNFLIGRNGFICVGRHESYARIREGLMVVSAHCPFQNDQPGIEFEHDGNEPLTPAQLESGIALTTWIAFRCKIHPYAIYPHRKYFPTDCPTDAIATLLPSVRHEVAQRI